MTQLKQAPQEQQMTQAATKIGRIVAVTGAHAIILLEADNIPGDDLHKSPEIGTLLKVDTEPSVALALISSMSTPTPGVQSESEDLRIVEVEFIGELPKDDNGSPGSFRRGISCYPALGDVVERATSHELAMTYASKDKVAVRVGHIKQDSSIPAMVKTDELLGKHFAVLGATGTGKSCAVALILRRILEHNPLAHILLLDVHREYASAFRDFGEIITPDNLVLPYWLLTFEEISEIIFGNSKNREADIEILRELIPMAKQRYKGARTTDSAASKLRNKDNESGSIGVDTPVPYRISDLVGLLDMALGKLELKGELAPYKRLKARIEQISRDARYTFMFGSLTVHDSMAEILGHLFRIPVNDKPITILELGGLPSEIINVVVSVLARMAFDFGLWSGGQVPITFVCEEAHRYVPFDDSLGFEPTKRAISKIAKEGRKYGVSLCIVSQRPAELDPTILSQCNTVFSMRLTNERDQELLRAGISDAAASLLEFVPTMGTGEAIAFGEGVSLPTRIKFDLLPVNTLPKSNTARFSEQWNRNVTDPDFLKNIVACWRQQKQMGDNSATEATVQHVGIEHEPAHPPVSLQNSAVPGAQPATISPAPAPVAQPVAPAAAPVAQAVNTAQPALGVRAAQPMQTNRPASIEPTPLQSARKAEQPAIPSPTPAQPQQLAQRQAAEQPAATQTTGQSGAFGQAAPTAENSGLRRQGITGHRTPISPSPQMDATPSSAPSRTPASTASPTGDAAREEKKPEPSLADLIKKIRG